MKKESLNIINSLNESVLNEKINKDNIEINKALANPNLGKNRDKIKAAGYDVDEYDGKVHSIKNSKTGKRINPSMYNRDEKGKIDFKGKLDSERPYNGKVNVYKSYAGKGKDIPTRAIVGKTKDGNAIANSEEFDSYSAHTSIADSKPNYKSISKNVNDYKDAVKNRDEKARWAQRNRDSLSYYEDKVKQAQDDLDREKKYIDKYDKESKDSEEKRKEILAKAKAKRNESEEVLKEEDRPNIDEMLSDIYDSYKAQYMEENFWIDLGSMVDDYDRVLEWWKSLNEGCTNKIEESETTTRQDLIKIQEKGSGLYDYVANNYYKMTSGELKELALNAIYVADADAEIIQEYLDRNEE